MEFTTDFAHWHTVNGSDDINGNVPGFGGPGFESGRGSSPNWFVFSLINRISLVVGFCANVIALYIMHRCRNMSDFNTNETTGTLLKYLLTLDATATASLSTRQLVADLIQTKSFYCDLTYITNLLFSWSCGFINMALCIERCVALAAPFWYYSHASKWKAHCAGISCIAIALICCLLPVMGLGSYRKVKIPFTGTYVCISPADLSVEADGEVFAFAVIFLIVGIGIVFVIHVANMIVVVNIIKIGMRNKKIGVIFGDVSSTAIGSADNSATATGPDGAGMVENMQQGGAVLQGKSHRKLMNKEIRLALIIVALSFVFTVAWLPYYVSYNL